MNLEQTEQAVKNIPAYHQHAMNELREEQLMNDAATPIVPYIQNDALRKQAAEELTFYVVKNELLNAFMPTDTEWFTLLLEAFVAATHERNGELTTMHSQLRQTIENEQPTTFDQLQHLLRRLTLAYEGSTPVDGSTVERMVLLATAEFTRSFTELKEHEAHEEGQDA